MPKGSTRGRPRPWLMIVSVFGALALGVVPGGIAAAETETAPSQPQVVGMTGGDNVHISRSVTPTASAHGWWVYDPQSELQADVTVQLQLKRGGTWVDVGAPGVKRLRPSTGGSGRRSNARVPCLNATETEWRSVVDVDVVDKIDNPGKLITPQQRLVCGA